MPGHGANPIFFYKIIKIRRPGHSRTLHSLTSHFSLDKPTKKIKKKIQFKKILSPDFDIKLVSWYQHSATVKSCISITWVSSNMSPPLKRFGPVNQTIFAV